MCVDSRLRAGAETQARDILEVVFLEAHWDVLSAIDFTTV